MKRIFYLMLLSSQVLISKTENKNPQTLRCYKSNQRKAEKLPFLSEEDFITMWNFAFDKTIKFKN